MNNIVKELRKEHNLTQAQLSSHLNISRKALSAIENGKSEPSLTHAYQISNYFGKSIEDIFLKTSNTLSHDYTKDKPIKYIDLFAGIGGFRFGAINAFDRLNIESKCVFSSEIDKHAQKSYEANFDEVPSGDISKVCSTDIPDHDFLFAGFPCQPFSIIGLGKGFDDIRGTLFFEIARILRDKRPKAFVLENVKRLVGHNNGNTMTVILKTLRDLGYHVETKVLNALDYGLPQKRERIIIVGALKSFKFEQKFISFDQKTLSEILENDILEKYYASEEIINKRKRMHTPSNTPSIWHENKSGNITSYPYSCALRAGASYNYLLVNGERRLTSRELLALQGFPNDFKIVVSDSQIRKQTGNAVPVNMIEGVLMEIIPQVF